MTASVLQPVDVQSHNARMIRLIGLLLLLLPGILSASGCQSSRLGRVPAPYRNYHEAGVAVIGPTYELDATTTVKSKRPVLLTLKSNQAVPYRGRDVYPDYLAYANPDDRAGAGEVAVGFSEPVVEVRSGFALLIGTSPMGKTKRIRAVGEGTTMIIEIDESGANPVHRVYLIADDHSVAHVYEEPGGGLLGDLRRGEFGEIEDVAGATWKKGDYIANQYRDDFVKKVLAEAKPIVGNPK